LFSDRSDLIQINQRLDLIQHTLISTSNNLFFFTLTTFFLINNLFTESNSEILQMVNRNLTEVNMHLHTNFVHQLDWIKMNEQFIWLQHELKSKLNRLNNFFKYFSSFFFSNTDFIEITQETRKVEGNS